MKNFLFLALAQFRSFWKARASVFRLFFSIERLFFKFRYGLREEETNFRTLRDIWQVTQAQIILAIVLSVGLQVVDPYLKPLYNYINVKIPDDSDYVTLLATISGIGGIFIGLYYAGISAVGSAIYSGVPNNIRDLLARERIGNVYMRYLALLTFMGLCLIGLRILGYPRIHVAIPLVVLLSGVGIIAFVKLGQRAFYLFDPTHLCYSIFDDLRHWLKMVCASGYRWSDPAFQNHANKQAKNALETLETLSDITGKETHLNGRPYAELAQQILGFLILYEKSKNRIPSTSLWFEQRYTHRDWYRSEETALSIAHQTGTILQPEIVNDKLWIEDKLLQIILHCITMNIKAKRYSIVQELLAFMDAYLQGLSDHGELNQAFDIIEKLDIIVFSEIGALAEDLRLNNEPVEHLGLSEHLATMPITLLLSFSKTLSELKTENLSNRLAHIRWTDAAAIYLQGFHSYVLPSLEWFKSRLTFELAVEDEIISPLWYQTELILQIEAEKLVENVNCLISRSAQRYQRLIEQLNTAKHPWLCSAIISREWEYWNKTQHHLNNFGKVWADFTSNRYIEDLPWPDFNSDQIQEQIKDRQKELLKVMAKQSTLLLLFPRPNEYPDYGGQFLHTTGESIVDTLCNNDLEILKSIFKPYFYGCLQKFDLLRPRTKVSDWRAQQKVKIAAAALLDLMDLSGYARLLADFHGNPDLWQEITVTWDEYLVKGTVPSPIDLLAAAIVITEAMFEIPYRSVIRISWKQRVEQCLAILPRRKVYSRRIGMSEDVVIHESPLVRIFARGPFESFHDGIDIFISLYLKKRPEKEELDFGRRRRDLEEDMQYEEERYKKMTSTQGGDEDEEI